jgi:hypothetical protein
MSTRRLTMIAWILVALAAGFDGAYLRFTGEMTLEHYRRGATVASVTEPALRN